MKVLLVEPDYKNKYPPIGLMKISTYHKNRGDEVVFYKGLLDPNELKDIERVYITSLFTFYFNKTVNTVEYYKRYFDDSQIYAGGIMVTIMPDRFREQVGGIHLLTGLLTNSSCLGLNDEINIDELPLDYGMLDECEYEYPAGDNYFSYTTRGCPNHCSFCAVPILEPVYSITNNIKKQITYASKMYGERRNLLLLDNNIFNLGIKDLRQLVDDLKSIGFTHEPTYIRETLYERVVRYPQNRISTRLLNKTETFLKDFRKRVRGKEEQEVYRRFLKGAETCEDKRMYFFDHKKEIEPIIQKYKYKAKMKRYVDFNQGLEAGRITAEKMEILSELPLRPVRIAFDHYTPGFVQKYTNAIRISSKCGIKEFSNYMLYNYKDTPDDLWNRLKINIELVKDLKINIFSFPMKYMPISEIDRKYVGKHWNKKFLSSVQAILLVSKGIVADGESFFYRAFGKNCDEFKKILTMPKDFIIYRDFYDKRGMTSEWEDLYIVLNESEKETLIKILSGQNSEIDSNSKIHQILRFYNQEYFFENIKKRDALV